VLFPPLTRPVLVDLAGGLLGAVIRRAGGPPPPAMPQEEPDVIDLAEDDDA
jgi:hypothetical protein